MLTIILKRSEEPKVIQMTQMDLVKQLDEVQGSEILLEDTWVEGLRKVRTPFVCLVEADCVLSAHYMTSNYGLMKKSQSQNIGGKGSGRGAGGGGNTKLAMLASCIGIKSFANRIYNYELKKTVIEAGTNVTAEGDRIELATWQVQPKRKKVGSTLYHVQVGFVPGSIIRMKSVEDMIDSFEWDQTNLVKLSAELSFHLWNTGRTIKLNPNTTYVTNQEAVERPPAFNVNIPDTTRNLFMREMIGLW